MQVLYVVKIEVDPAVVEDWKQWTVATHMPDVVAEAGFTRGTLYNVESPQGEWPRFVAAYKVESFEALQTYLNGPGVVRLRADAVHRYGESLRITREVLQEVAVIVAPA